MTNKILGSVLIVIACVALIVSLRAEPKKRRGIDLLKVVEAIRQVENWDGSAVGAAGEAGPWQMTRRVWEEFSDKPWFWASGTSMEQKLEQHRVAVRYVEWIEKNLMRSAHWYRYYRSAYYVGLCYTAGFRETTMGNPSKAKRDYAQRVQNVYDQLTKQHDGNND